MAYLYQHIRLDNNQPFYTRAGLTLLTKNEEK